MNNYYLTPDKKKYYSTDFVENVLTETNESWKINDSIRTYLIDLNNCHRLQPIFSKFPDLGTLIDDSYLEIAYTNQIESKLKQETIPHLKLSWNKTAENFSFSFSGPKTNTLIRPEKSKMKMECLNNPDYFKINHFRFTFINSNIDKHIEFWEELIKQLKRF